MSALALPGVSIRLIQQLVATRCGISLDDMRSPSRKRDVAWPRQIAMALSREFTAKSWQSIGNQFGGRDHTTVIHAQRAVWSRSRRDRPTAEHLTFLRAMLERIAPKPAEENMPDLYAELGVARDATPDQIKAAHRKGVREHHPDRGGDKARFQALQLAYDTLKDEEKRRRYDESGTTAGAAEPDMATQLLAMLIHNLIDQMLQEGTPIETADMRQLMVDGAKGKILELKHERGRIEKAISRAAGLSKRWRRKPRAKGPDLIGDTIRRRERDLADSLKRIGEAEEAWARARKMLDDYTYDFDAPSADVWSGAKWTTIRFDV